MNAIRFAAVLLILPTLAVACGGGSPATAPQIAEVAPWYDGRWRAVSVNGIPMPAVINNRTYTLFEVGVANKQGGVQMNYSTLNGILTETVSCNDAVELNPKGTDTLITTEYNNSTKCASVTTLRHTFVKSGATEMTTVFNGNSTFVLRKY